MLQVIYRIVLSYVVLLLIFVGSLYVVNNIPTEMVRKNLEGSVAVIKHEGMYPSRGISWRKIVLDNFTDAIMLNVAYSVDSNDPLRSSIRTIQHDGDEKAEDQALNLEKIGQKSGVHETVYERYWHGYLIFLRPLLTIGSYAHVRVVWSIALYILAGLVFVEMRKRVGIRAAFAFLIGLIAVDFFWIGESLQLSNVFMTGMIGSYILLKNQHWSFSSTLIFFFIMGGVTSYIDFLSAPLVGLSLLLFIAVERIRGKLVQKVALLAFFWMVGYSSLWASKWFLAEFTYVRGAITSGYTKVEDRMMSPVDAEFSRVVAVKRNFLQFRGYDKRNKFALLYLGIGYSIFMLRYLTFRSARFERVIIFLGLGFLPYAWYFFAAEHSYIHVLFTYRNQLMTVISFFLLSCEFVHWEKLRKDCRIVARKT
ncbi:MAG: hypothetical protein UX04_C0002G0276 [Microgenomates group bacterium GW2011_GWF2_45_18]|nr:MAG: hypothetical protein UW18_C0003G0286 [Microgenomates group bacterium GW2011_GWF1_44_10]KKU02133.1 MAG: hypothetical protein UX04_C0002G0276 [Microgenomates group bacterium GW2011_GWF2_45_18]OGJ41775.1 MAG: hypothetical protein A2378_00650 [Candidatus Pacebacteria bacterium RIFOXYB1_FULL_44_10]HAU98683.1 hypothetical protein [Candidatus Paceibacterota bacterium]HAX01891.1 hypothetical protein [Candidatus Paceibacterota bacterium]